VAAREERRVDVEARVVRGRTDEADRAFLDVGQEQVLLGFVEPMELVDEENRGGLGAAARGGEDFTQLGDVGHDGVDTDKAAARLVRDGFGDAGFSAPGGP